MTIDDKVLCVCEGGNVRSAALAFILKMNKIDALACGVTLNKPETIKVLCDWADIILVAEGRLIAQLPVEAQKKAIDMEIGPDIWGIAMTGVMQVSLDKLNAMFKTLSKEDENISTDSDNRQGEGK